MRRALAAGMLLAACRNGNADANANVDAHANANADANASANANADANADADADSNAGAWAFVSVREGTVAKARYGERVYEAASIAKLFVAVSVMQLVERGQIDLEAPISKYVAFVSRPITMRQLLTHTAGIVDGERPEKRADSLDPFLRAHLAKASARGDGGARYSNVGFALAASVVEHVTGGSFADYTESNIFSAIGMTRTTWTAPPGFPSHVVYPSVDLFSTADDLALFAIAILDDRLLKPETTRRMLDEGLGWQSRSFGGRAVLGHEGEDVAASTAFFVDRKSKTAAIVLADDDTFQSHDHARLTAFSRLLESLL